VQYYRITNVFYSVCRLIEEEAKRKEEEEARRQEGKFNRPITNLITRYNIISKLICMLTHRGKKAFRGRRATQGRGKTKEKGEGEGCNDLLIK